MSSEKKNSGKVLLLLVASVSTIILIYCIIRLTQYGMSGKKSKEEVNELKNKIEKTTDTDSDKKDKNSFENTDLSDPDEENTVKEDRKEILSKYKTLYADNPDFIGWITIADTKVDYPVMQTVDDEEFYLHMNFEKDESKAGLPFLDARCDFSLPSTNLIVYGHNMKNGDVFADLLKYADKSFLEDHEYIDFDTLYAKGRYKIISVFRTDVSQDSDEIFKFYDFVNDSASYPLSRYLNEIKDKSLYTISFDEEDISSLLTLVTCEYTKKDGRFVIISAKVSDI